MFPQLRHPSPSLATDNPESEPQGPRGLLKHRCGLCLDTVKTLSLCSGCRVVRYCCKEHENKHRQQHLSACNNIKSCRIKLDSRDAIISDAIAASPTLANTLGNQDYLRARFKLAKTLHKSGTLDGVTEALDHLQDMLRLPRSDKFGIRKLIPPMMLQLDRDSECYNFIKRWEVQVQRDYYGSDEQDRSILSSNNEDVLEDVSYLMGQYRVRHACIHRVSTVLLLKLKLLVDIINIKLARKVNATRVIPDIWKSIELRVIRSPISRQWAGIPYRRITEVQRKLEMQIRVLAAECIQDLNENYFRVLLDVQEHNSKHTEYSEAQELLRFSYPTWWQHEGVLELLHAAKVIAGKDGEDEFEEMMNSEPFSINSGSGPSREQLFNDVSRDRLWSYIDDAAADAISLSQIRPSDVGIQQRKAAWEAAVARGKRESGEGDAARFG